MTSFPFSISPESPPPSTTCWKCCRHGPPAKKDLESALEALLRGWPHRKIGKRQFTLSKHVPLYEGILEQNPRGFGFAAHCTSNIDAPPLIRDPFIPASRMKSAHQGDRILIRVHGPGNKERPEASVIKVLARGTERLAGFFSSHDRAGGGSSPKTSAIPLQSRLMPMHTPSSATAMRSSSVLTTAIPPPETSEAKLSRSSAHQKISTCRCGW